MVSDKENKLHLSPGTVLGKYRLVRHINSGGHCEVWQGRDLIEGIMVAIKIPLEDVNGRRESDQLLREIKSVAKLRHPNILSVKNADIIKGHALLVTELSNKTLEDCSRPMGVRRITHIILQILEGLSFAHKHRIVHCDISPSNIFLFDDKRAALGDFGISLKQKGKAKTVDDFGTPGYVAPEQAYGYPTFRSDCFSVGVILYEYISGVLPRWPFKWTQKDTQRLKKKIGHRYIDFIKHALAVDPDKRFCNAAAMRTAMLEALPVDLKIAYDCPSEKPSDWMVMRKKAFVEKYDKVLGPFYKCVDCGHPIWESSKVCPWCGSGDNTFQNRTKFKHYCPFCKRGVLEEWKYCPHCYSPGFLDPCKEVTRAVKYHGHCNSCGGRLMRFMKYCPHCHKKVSHNWDVRPFPQLCGYCNWPVDTEFFDYCPWCTSHLK